jgi:hypothetical protein
MGDGLSSAAKEAVLLRASMIRSLDVFFMERASKRARRGDVASVV